MPSTAIWFGRLLILVGAVGYGYGFYNGNASFTALIPAAFGIVLMLLGHLASNESMRKHLMHAAVVVALLGFILPFGRIMSKISEFTLNAAAVSQLAMAIICLIFVVLAVRSFIAARASEPPA